MGRTSNKREEILRFLTQFVAENGYAPSVREICAAVGLQSTATVHYHLGALREAGIVGGLQLDAHHMLWCATEMNTVAEMDAVKAALEVFA